MHLKINDKKNYKYRGTDQNTTSVRRLVVVCGARHARLRRRRQQYAVSETTTTIGLRTPRIGIGAAGHSHKGTADIERIGPPVLQCCCYCSRRRRTLLLAGRLTGWPAGNIAAAARRVTVETCGFLRRAAGPPSQLVAQCGRGPANAYNNYRIARARDRGPYLSIYYIFFYFYFFILAI